MTYVNYGIGGKRGQEIIEVDKILQESKYFSGDAMDSLVLASVIVDKLKSINRSSPQENQPSTGRGNGT